MLSRRNLPESGGVRTASPTFQRSDEVADDKKNRGAQDRARVSGSEGYEVSYFARKHGITSQQARDLIKQVGNSREKLNAAAAKLK
jgi:hypothetical protein